MESHILLSQLRSLLARAPAFASYSPSSTEHQQWLGQAYALVKRWNASEAFSLKLAWDLFWPLNTRNSYLAQIFGVLNRAVADLELQLPAGAGQAFGPGAVYDFFKELKAVLSSAQKSILIVDPYLDDSVFDYLSSVPKGIKVRLLVNKYAAKLKPAAERYVAQYGVLLEVKCSEALHDRLVFVDDDVCWVMGQSIKDAAVSKSTYLAPLSSDVARLKLPIYERIWLQATAI